MSGVHPLCHACVGSAGAGGRAGRRGAEAPSRGGPHPDCALDRVLPFVQFRGLKVKLAVVIVAALLRGCT